MPTSEPSWFLTIGDFFADRYEVCALVGRGTHGAAFEARDKDTGNSVVLKAIHPDLLEEDADENLFLLRRVLAYRNNQLVPVRDLIETETQVVLVQPYLNTPNLRLHLQLRSDNKEGFSALSCLRLLTDVASGLSWVHRFGPHGNIKPENIFVADEGCRLHDAYRLDGIQKLDWAPDNPWTKDAYQAPEQYGSEEGSTLAADTYAFALIIGEALAGKPVKDGIRLSDQSSLVSFKAFDDLFVASTSRNPEDRPAMEEFVSEAGKALSSAGEDEHGAERDMNITLVTGIPVITESMAKDMASGLSAREVLEREDERQVSESEEEVGQEHSVPDLSESEREEIEDASLIGGEPLSVGFGMIVGKAISTVLGRDIGFSDDEETLEDSAANSSDLARQSIPPQTTTISKDDARAIVSAHGKRELGIPPLVPKHAAPQLIEDAAALEIIPLDATPIPDDEEAEVFAEIDEIPDYGDGVEELLQDTLKIEPVAISSDNLVVEEVAPDVASQLEEQLTVQPLGEAKDLVATEPDRIPRRERIRGAVDPTTLATEVTHRRDLRKSDAVKTPRDVSPRPRNDADETSAGPWYLSVIAAGLVAFSVVWFMASPSETPQETSSSPENATSSDEAPQASEPGKISAAAGSKETTGNKASAAAAAVAPDASRTGGQPMEPEDIANSLASTENALTAARELMEGLDKSAAVARSEAEAKTKAEAEAKANSDAETRAQAEAEAQTKAEADALAQAEAETQAKAEADALAQAEAGALAQAEAEALAQAEAEALAQAEADALVQAEADALVQAEADALAQAEAEALAQAEAEALAQAEAEAKVKAEMEARVPTPAAACRNGYAEIPGSEAKGAFCIQKLEYHGGEKRPLRRVKYDAAVKKCAMELGRLCTKEEFRAACGEAYPYGSRFNRAKCNVMSSFFEPRPIRPGGTMAGCQSPHGVFDLSGNVDEWVEGGLVAGGNSGQEGKNVACTRAVKRKPDRPTRSTGFRCCHDLN